MKRGQVALFAIIAILIIGGLTFLAYSQRITIKKAVSGEKPAIEPIKSEIQNCIDDSLVDGLYAIGQSGGYYNSVADFTSTFVAYYSYEGRNIAPIKKKIESELESYLEDNIVFCFDTSKFPDFEISADKKINANVTIFPSKVIADVNWPLKIKKLDKTQDISKFRSEYSIRLDAMYETANSIVQHHISTNSSLMPLSYPGEIGLARNIYYSTNEFENGTYVVTGFDNQSKINNKPYEFKFAIKLK